ncbi:MAG: RAMP superfamily CRISPR-associated protein [Candidatus Cloacimonetes bacterium]|nr:RAMP superfamily CRISPR-associated protein [Candidatus Cloacimonadota bacterium]
MNKTLRLFWAVELQFLSPIHIGKGSSDAYMGAAEVVQNGAGEYVIPGTSLAGLFFSGMMLCAKINKEDALFKRLLPDDQNTEASPIVFRTATLNPKGDYLRDRVRINRETKTADDKAKFSQWEVLPENTTVLIELDNVSKGSKRLSEEEVDRLKQWISQVLASWHKEGFFIGAHSSVGNGFTKVAKVKMSSLNKDNYQAYLSTASNDTQIVEKMQGTELDLATIEFNPCFKRRYRLTIKTGLHDPLLIKGNVFYPSRKNPETDAAFINRDGRPYIPGSSIRGAISSFMEKYQVPDWEELTGDTGKAGWIMFTDLTMIESEVKAEFIQIERHAEDQLSRAIYGPGKFDEERVFNAVFQGEILLASGNSLEEKSLEHIFGFLKDGLRHRLIGLGSGAAHPEMTLEEV